MWPVLWTTFFFGRRGAVAIVLCIGVAHAGHAARAARSEQLRRSLGRRDGVGDGRRGGRAHARAAATTSCSRSSPTKPARTRSPACSTGAASTSAPHWSSRARGAMGARWRWSRSTSTTSSASTTSGGTRSATACSCASGEMLSRESRDIDVIARFGGEEFVALLPGCRRATPRGTPSACARRSPTRRLRAARGAAERGHPRGARAGERRTMVQGADSALYNAKRAGATARSSTSGRRSSRRATTAPRRVPIGDRRPGRARRWGLRGEWVTPGADTSAPGARSAYPSSSSDAVPGS